MSDQTANLKLPFIAADQAQKHVTHNEALLALDAIVQASIVSRDLTAPPASPEEADAYIPAASASGDWAGHDGELAVWTDGAWRFYAPRAGWIVHVAAENRLVVFNGSVWRDFGEMLGALANLDRLGVNTTADATNRLAAKSDAVLFSHDDVTPGSGDIRVKLNKKQPDKTASFLFQDNWLGRAEIGIAGNDDFSIKVSPDGTEWRDALLINAETGEVSLPGSIYPKFAVFNLFKDGGRFSGSPEPRSYLAPSFQSPDWLNITNGASVNEHAKFYFNSSTYGGPAPDIHSDVKQLIEQLVDPYWRRYYPEFYLAKVTAGGGTNYGYAFADGITRYTAILTRLYMRPVFLTISYYVKILSGDVGIYDGATTSTLLDGQEQSGAFVIPADGEWHHVLVMDKAGFSRHYRDSSYSIRWYMRQGDEALLAFPSAIPGLMRLPANVGQTPSLTAF